MSNIPKTQHSKNPIPIDILLSVVDNFGDMGFACELMIAYESHFPWVCNFRVFTDSVDKVEEFFSRNSHLLGKYEIIPYETFVPGDSSDILFALFHFPLPKFHDERKRLILRFDYLSLDIAWTIQNESEHIESNNRTKIVEIIPSPLSDGSWLIHHEFPEISRSRWLQNAWLPSSLESKKWIIMFIYGSTNDRILWDSFDADTQIFLFSPVTVHQKNITHLSPISVNNFYALFSLSDFAIVRGEVSFVQALQSGKAFLWDVYKEIGGFPVEHSEQFLEFWWFDERYREIHAVLNGQKNGKITALDIAYISNTFPMSLSKKMSGIKNLVQETKKQVDRFYFSL